MSYLQALILGIIQGLTEFLPVSSSGHLVVLQRIMRLPSESAGMILFDLAVHLGTVAAILVYFRRPLGRYVRHLLASMGLLRRSPVEAFRRSASVRFTALAIMATAATGVFYVLFKDMIEEGFGRPEMVAGCWLLTAGLLFVTDRKHKHWRSIKQIGFTTAVVIGLAQGFALFPGISRSGSTICAAVLMGMHRRWAGQFSFLIGVPAIVIAAVIKILKFDASGEQLLPWGVTLVGTAVSAVTGFAALALLIWALKHARLKIFAIYCAVIALATWAAVALEIMPKAG